MTVDGEPTYYNAKTIRWCVYCQTEKAWVGGGIICDECLVAMHEEAAKGDGK